MLLKYQGRHRAGVYVDVLGRSVEYGETVEIPDELAGRAPKGRPATDKFDPGEGLLAQGGWVVAAPAKAGKGRKADEEED